MAATASENDYGKRFNFLSLILQLIKFTFRVKVHSSFNDRVLFGFSSSLYLQYPARSPLNGSNDLVVLRQDLVKAEPGLNRTASEQAIYQLAALGITLLIAIVGGAITGQLQIK